MIDSKYLMSENWKVIRTGPGENDWKIVLSDVKTDEDKSTSIGRKFDEDKLQYGLLPPLALKATVDVLSFGTKKYERDNWKYVPDAKRRYFDALQRHLWAWKEGEQIDSESGKHHLAHALCCLHFLFEHDILYSVDKS